MDNNKNKKNYSSTNNESKINYSILDCERLPARLLAEQVAVLIQCTKYEVTLLIREGILTPLGNPQNNCVKYFHAPTLEKLMQNVDFCNDVTDAIYRSNKKKNDAKNIIPFGRDDKNAA